MLKGKLPGQYIICEMVTTEKKKMNVRKCRTINRYVNVGHINTPSEASQAQKLPQQLSPCSGRAREKGGKKEKKKWPVEARKLNPLLQATDKFQLQKMHPIVSDHLLFSDRKRIITSVRGRRTDMPFRLGRECTSLIASSRNNFVLCLSFTLKSWARCVWEDSEMTVLWSALSQGCSTGNRARLHPSAPLFGKRKKKMQKCVKFHIPSFYIPSPCHSFTFPTQKLYALHRMSDMCAGWCWMACLQAA